MSMSERAARAAISQHASTCPRCRALDEGCPEAKALYRAWRSAWQLPWPGQEASRANGNV